MFCNIVNTLSWFSLSLLVTMVMKSAVEDDDVGWGLGIPEKMRNNANWVDITHEFKGSCKGKVCGVCVCVCTHVSNMCKVTCIKGNNVFFLSSDLVLILYLSRVKPWGVAS